MRDELVKEMTKTLARHVEWAAELARQYGYEFPREYDLGVKIEDHGRHGTLHLRVGDVRTSYRMAWSWEASTEAMQAFATHLARAGARIVQAYIEKHRSLHTNLQIEIGQIMRSDKWEKQVLEKANKAAKTATYTER